MNPTLFSKHAEKSVLVEAPAAQVFAYLDDPRAMAAHMGESSMMMMGSRMAMEVDGRGGRDVGSEIRMSGNMMGIAISLEEVITVRRPPHEKVWETIGAPRLVVIAQYRMGFEVTPQGDASLLRVFIDYSLPAAPPASWLGRCFSGIYARWCTRRIAEDAAGHFRPSPRAAAPFTSNQKKY